MFIRKTVFIAATLVLSLCLTGCMGGGDETTATSMPTQPVATVAATEIPGAAASSFDWRAEAENVEEAIEQLSEIDDARVAIAGNTALVGVKFDDAYRGEMTDRIRQMIDGVVRKADPSIQTVAVTAAESDVERIFDMSDRVSAGEAFEDFREDIDRIMRNVTTMR